MSKAQAATSTEGLPPPGGGRPVDADRPTRKPLGFWDRIKFLLLLTLLWFVLVWSVMANDPLVGFSDAMRIEVRSAWWVFVLLGLELLRQVHFLISEHWRGISPVLDLDGVRRRRARHAPEDVELDQVPHLADA